MVRTPRDVQRVAITTTALILTGVCGGRGTRAASGWPDERIVGTFHCHADFSLDPHGPMLVEMARLQDDLTRTLGIRSAQETVHLFLFHRESVYKSYIREYFPEVPYRRALFIKDQGPGMVFAFQNTEFAIDLRHESTHALLHAALPLVPLWLDEGLAEYFEVPAADRPGKHPHMTKVRWSARFGNIPKLERLEQIRELEQMGQKEYREAWAWVHFMLDGSSEARDELTKYLAALQSHSPPGILSHRLRIRLPDLDRQFSEHFKTWSP
ncbi:MAG: DUF1570 domain-containing protein [Pirellulaceae bacterium]